jgi:hypothetical protein
MFRLGHGARRRGIRAAPVQSAAFHTGGTSGAGKVLRSEIIDGVRFLGRPLSEHLRPAAARRGPFDGRPRREIRLPILNGHGAHFGFDTLYVGRNNTDTTGALSSYAWVPGSSITDADIGFAWPGNRFDVSPVVKNLTNNNVPVLRTWNSYEPAFARWWGPAGHRRVIER